MRPKVNILHRMRSRLSRAYFGEQIPKPTAEELDEGAHHAHQLAESYTRQLDSGSSEGDSGDSGH